MITIENLHKTYKGKKVEAVNALRGVSFTLPDTGMVFILGKSGCGKSTLLNVLGGLDGFDGGDIVVDGKSMKGFSAKDYDEYRNNYVGFVFQENNLLEQYTVKRNVALALELQSQNKVDEKIAEALNAVDLKDFAERRCNRLSGGQKQRVAIARALIKKPEMLLCDEPTGSLDSDTGKEIFELLKEISKNTLVVVVSHDRDSAERYGDRVIEIKDGSVLSDNKPEEEHESEPKQKEQKKSGLPFRRAFAMGAGFLIARPIRFALCMLICFLTFTCVGISDAFSAYDRDKAVAVNMQYYKTSHLSYSKKSMYEDNEGISILSNPQTIAVSELVNLTNVLKSDRIDSRYTFSLVIRNNTPFNQMKTNSWYFWTNGYVEMDESFAKDYGFTLYGEYPKAYDEVVLTKHIFNGFKINGYTDETGKIEINSYDDIIGKKISLTEQYWAEQFERKIEFKVVGVLDTNLNEEVYGDFLYGNNANSPDGVFAMLDTMHLSVYCCKGYRDAVFLPLALELNEDINVEELKDIISVYAPLPSDYATLLSNVKVYKKYREIRGKYWSELVDTEGGEEEEEPEEEEEDDKVYFYAFDLENDAANLVRNTDNDMYFYGTLFKYVSIGTSVISVLFLLYFTSGIISEKKREIGILRAMGASRGDTVKIFCLENAIFAVAVVALATLFSAVGLVVINSMLGGLFNSQAKFIAFGIRQFAVLAAVAIGAIAAGIAIPIIRLLRAKPVDIIAGRK